MISPATVASARSAALAELRALGITDSFVVKIKQPRHRDWVAMYRGGTQFTGRGRGPIFWVSECADDAVAEALELDRAPTTAEVLSALTDSVLHEYGHVIAEWAWTRNPDMARIISREWSGQYHGRPWDEERFAEDFAMWRRGGFVYGSERALQGVVDLYVLDVFEPEPA